MSESSPAYQRPGTISSNRIQNFTDASIIGFALEDIKQSLARFSRMTFLD